MSFRINRGQIPSNQANKGKKANPKIGNEFKSLLEESIKESKDIKISAHAQERLDERNMDLKDGDIKLINRAMDDLEKKGARESLMLYKDMAFIASVSNRTIITALQYEDIELVTNIDSAIVVK